MSWVAVIILCAAPTANTCYPVSFPEPFAEINACKQKVLEGVNLFTTQGFFARGKCLKINIVNA